MLTTCWPDSRLKYHLARMVAGGTPTTSNSDYWDDEAGALWIAIADMTGRDTVIDTAKKVSDKGIAAARLVTLPAGSLLFAMYASLGTMAFLGAPATTNQAILGLLPREGRSDNRYIRYWLQALKPHLRSYSRTNTQDNLNAEVVGNLPFPDIPFDRQLAIGDFLDRETERTDRLVEKKRRLIELLDEKRTALISHAVTKGLDPTVQMKDSGFEWIGDIPAHWQIAPLMRLVPDDRRIMYGIVLPGPSVEDGVPIIKSGDVKPGRLLPDLLDRTTHDIESRYVRSRVFPGDIVYSIRGSVGSAEIVPAELPMANLTQDAARVAPGPGVDRNWLLYSLRCNRLFGQLEAGMSGAAVKGVNIRDLKRLRIPTPPSGEQLLIGQALANKTHTVDQLESKLSAQLDMLAEYRQALITAAVTGQIDVTADAPDPEEAMA